MIFFLIYAISFHLYLSGALFYVARKNIQNKFNTICYFCLGNIYFLKFMPIHCLPHTNTYQNIDIIYIKHRCNISKSLKIRLLTHSICRYLFHFIWFNIIAFFFSFSLISLVNNSLKTLSLRSSDKYYLLWENTI